MNTPFAKETINEILLWRLANPKPGVAYYAEEPSGGFRAVHHDENRRETLAVAAGLHLRGLARGDRVAILATTRHEWVRCDLANLVLGLVTIGIYPTCTPETVRYLLEHSGARALVVETQAHLDALVPALGGEHGVEVIFTMEPGLTAPADLGVPVADLEELLAAGRADLDTRGDEHLLAEAGLAEPDDLVTIVYTSGTTGEPKGAMLTHRNLFHVSDSVCRMLPFDEDDRSIVYLPLAHILQRYTVYLGLRTGASAHYLSDIPRLGEVLEIARPTILAAVPRVLEKVYAKAMARADSLDERKRRVFDWAFALGHDVAAAGREGRAIGWWTRFKHRVADRLVLRKVRQKLGGHVKYVVSGGAPLAPHLSEWFHACGLLVVEGYGLTETAAPATASTPDSFRFGTVGRAIPGTEVKIADDGEILVQGPGVFTGYFGNPAATAEAFTADGFFRTGDIGELDADGFLRITDRKKNILITAGGKNIAPQPIENLLKEHPLIGQAMVCGDRQPYLVALLTLDHEVLPDWAAERGLAEGTPAALAANPEILAAVERHVAAVNEQVARYESLKRWRVLPVAFVPENGYLTPTLKLKRRAIVQDFGDVIDALYT